MLRVLKPSPAMAVALLALFVALGGSGYAAVKINGKDIRDRSVAGKKLKNRTVTAKQIKRGTLTGAQVKRGSLTGRQIREGSLGAVPKAAVAEALTAEGAKSYVPSTRFQFGELVRMSKSGTAADTPLRTLIARGPFKVEVGCYVDADKTGAKLRYTSTEANSVLDNEQGTATTREWSTNAFSAATTFATFVAPSGATMGVAIDAVVNGLGSDCAYVLHYTTNR